MVLRRIPIYFLSTIVHDLKPKLASKIHPIVSPNFSYFTTGSDGVEIGLLLRILGAWCKSPNKRILSYKDALHRTQCESIETTVRTRRLLWAGALLRMGDHR